MKKGMVFSACSYPKMPGILSQIKQKDGFLSHYPLSPLISSSPSLPYNSYIQKDSTPSSSSLSSSSSGSGTKITPAILFIIVILAVIFFISGLLHLFVRFLSKHRSSTSHSHPNRYPEMSGSETFQRQLQQLFHLHDSGLDQAFIDALPVFHYKEIVGLKQPFDCAVCLCEFSEQDKLRLLPMCSHAFHINCIDTWLLSNSTCPLCRGSLYTPGIPMVNSVFDFEDSREEVGFSGHIGGGVAAGPTPAENEIISGKRVFSVRLGKYRSLNNEVAAREGEASSSNLDARRCYSMGSFQYVVANSDLQVAFCHNKVSGNGGGGDVRFVKGRGGQNGNSSIDGDCEGKKINIGSKGDSFSVSKIWLWSKKSKFPSSSDTLMGADMSLPWTKNTRGI